MLSSGINVHFDVGANYQSPLEPYIIPGGPRPRRRIDRRAHHRLQPHRDRSAMGLPVFRLSGCPSAGRPASGSFATSSSTAADRRELRDRGQPELRSPIRSQPEGHVPLCAVRARARPAERAVPGHGRQRRRRMPAGERRLPRAAHQFRRRRFPRSGDLLVTLGGFDDGAGLPIGTAFMQASTLMHELGHTFELDPRRRSPRAARAQLQAELSERDELPVPAARPAD